MSLGFFYNIKSGAFYAPTAFKRKILKDFIASISDPQNESKLEITKTYEDRFKILNVDGSLSDVLQTYTLI